MKLTSALAVRRLIANLHPPLPPTSRESQQLLALLQASFKRQLDEAHPPPLDGNAAAAPLSGPNQAAAATNYHLQSVLHHPLLEQRATAGPSNAAAMFDAARLSDNVDFKLIERCVRMQQNASKAGASAASAGPQNLGHKISSWLTSTNGAVREAFLSNYRLMDIVVPMMYSSGLEEVVWEWLRMLYEGDLGSNNPNSRFNPTSHSWLKIEDRLISLMVRESIRRNDMATAVHEYIQACHFRFESRPTSQSSQTAPVSQQQPPLSATWRQLTSALLRRRSSRGIPASLYDQLLRFTVPLNLGQSIDRPFLLLYHPSSPTAEPLRQALRNPEYAQDLMSWVDGATERLQKAILTSILDGAQLSVDQSLPRTARSLLEFAEDNFSTWISPRTEEDPAARIELARQEIQPRVGPTELAVT